MERNTQETVELSPEQMNMLRIADDAFERGEAGVPLEEALERAGKRTQVWLKNPDSLTA